MKIEISGTAQLLAARHAKSGRQKILDNRTNCFFYTQFRKCLRSAAMARPAVRGAGAYGSVRSAAGAAVHR